MLWKCIIIGNCIFFCRILLIIVLKLMCMDGFEGFGIMCILLLLLILK